MSDDPLAPRSGAIIEMQRLFLRSAEHPVLRDLNLRVERGEIFALLGPIGSGKSSALKLIAGMIGGFQGTAVVDGFDLATHGDQARARIGYMPGYLGAYGDLTASGYLEFFSRACGVDPDAIDGRIQALLALAGLGDRADAYVSTLGDEARHRLAVVKTAVHRPPLLIFDDPAAGLPSAARIRLRGLIREVAATGNHSVLICSNILTDLIGLCGRIGLMHAGRLIASGSADAIARRLTGARILEIEPAGAAEGLIESLRAHPAIDAANMYGENVLASLAGEIEDPGAVLRGFSGIAAFREHQIDLDLLVGQLVKP